MLGTLSGERERCRQDEAALAEWLRRQPAKLMGNARVGSNPAGRAFFETCIFRFHFFILVHLYFDILWYNSALRYLWGLFPQEPFMKEKMIEDKRVTLLQNNVRILH